MKGLILKDMYAIRQLSKSIGLIVLFYMALSIYSKSTGFEIFTMVFLANSAFIQVFTSDQQSKWESYALALPISHRTMVMGRYAYGLIITAMSTVVGTAMAVITYILSGSSAYQEAVVMVVCGIVLTLVMMSLLFPTLYQFGADKGRMLFAGMIIFFVACIGGFLNIMVNKLTGFISNALLPEKTMIWITIAGVLSITLLMLAVSFYCSQRIVERKGRAKAKD